MSTMFADAHISSLGTCGLQDYPGELRDWSEALTVGAWVWAKRRVILELNIIVWQRCSSSFRQAKQCSTWGVQK